MKHGTHSGYSHGCRCKNCVEGHRIYERNQSRRRRRIKYGLEEPVVRLIDSSEARDHVRFLTSKGIGLGSIANQVGTNRTTIQYIKKGKYKRISLALSKKILAVPAIPREPMAYISAEPIHKLLAQLEKKGVSSRDVGRVLGCRHNRLVIKNKMRVWRYQQIEAVCKEMLRLRP